MIASTAGRLLWLQENGFEIKEVPGVGPGLPDQPRRLADRRQRPAHPD